MILYLYGDLAIYDAAVPKSLRDTIWYTPLDHLSPIKFKIVIYFLKALSIRSMKIKH